MYACILVCVCVCVYVWYVTVGSNTATLSMYVLYTQRLIHNSCYILYLNQYLENTLSMVKFRFYFFA